MRGNPAHNPVAVTRRTGHGSVITGQRTVQERVSRHGYSPPILAENILSLRLEEERNPTCAELAAEIVDRWMNSPVHRANLLLHELYQLGCAIRIIRLADRAEAVYAVQVFSF